MPSLFRYASCSNFIHYLSIYLFVMITYFIFDTPPPICGRNVPGQALYLTSVQQVRNAIGRVLPSFALTKDAAGERLSTLIKLTPTGNLVAGAVTRTAIGFVVNPLTVVKVRYEVRARLPYCTEACCLSTCPNGIIGHGEEWGGMYECMYAEHVVCRATITLTKASLRPCNRCYAKGREHSFKGSVRLRYEMRRTQGRT